MKKRIAKLYHIQNRVDKMYYSYMSWSADKHKALTFTMREAKKKFREIVDTQNLDIVEAE